MEELYKRLTSSNNLYTSKINESASSEYAKLRAEVQLIVEEVRRILTESQGVFEAELQKLKATMQQQKENNSTLNADQLSGLQKLLKKDRANLLGFKGEIKLLQDPSTYTSIVTPNLKKGNYNVRYWLTKTFEGINASGHALFTIKQEGADITCTILALNCKVSKTQNSMRLSMEQLTTAEERVCDTVLEDVKGLVLSLSTSKNCEGRINIEALNTEYVLCFCVKHGFVPDDSYDRTLSDNSFIPMTLTVGPEELTERRKGTRRLVYSGKNWKGNIFHTYSDGSYSYLNMDRTTGGPISVYQSEGPDGLATIGYVPYPKRQPLADDSNSDDSEASQDFPVMKRKKINL